MMDAGLSQDYGCHDSAVLQIDDHALDWHRRSVVARQIQNRDVFARSFPNGWGTFSRWN